MEGDYCPHFKRFGTDRPGQNCTPPGAFLTQNRWPTTTGLSTKRVLKVGTATNFTVS